MSERCGMQACRPSCTPKTFRCTNSRRSSRSCCCCGVRSSPRRSMRKMRSPSCIPPSAALRTRTGNDQLRRAEAADRDLDAVMVLFDAAARFTDRLPGARIQTFVEHVLGQQLPADSIAGSGDRGEAVRLLTAHAAKG